MPHEIHQRWAHTHYNSVVCSQAIITTRLKSHRCPGARVFAAIAVLCVVGCESEKQDGSSHPAIAPSPSKSSWKELASKVEIHSKPANVVKAKDISPAPAPAHHNPNGFDVAYGPSQQYADIKSAFESLRLFDDVAHALNSSLRMPRTVTIQMAECDTINAYYDPLSARIIMCYEIIAHFARLFAPHTDTDDAHEAAITGATSFAFFHELGHALIDILGIPTTGREEDAVDQLATLVLIEAGDTGVKAAMAGAQWFALQSQQQEQDIAFWSEHSMAEQRFYNIACLIYGSAPDKYAALVTQKHLPASRADRCRAEYTKLSQAWTKLLANHLTEGAKTTDEDHAGWGVEPDR